MDGVSSCLLYTSVRKIGKTTYKGARTFQHHQHRNHERQNQTDAEKRGAADASFL